MNELELEIAQSLKDAVVEGELDFHELADSGKVYDYIKSTYGKQVAQQWGLVTTVMNYLKETL